MARAGSVGSLSGREVPGPDAVGRRAGATGRERLRALGLHASAIVAVGLSLLSWGRSLAWIMIAYAFFIHISAAAGAIARRPFLGFNSRLLRSSLATFLIALVYAPILLAGAILAWPALDKRDGSAIFLVNRHAFHGRVPVPGEMLWIESKAPGSSNLARAVAVEGQEVSWSPGRLSVDGTKAVLHANMTGKGRFRVPSNLLLVTYESVGGGGTGGEPVLIEAGQVIGKAWARSDPIGILRLLR
jgi:hypothetical protein